MGSVTLLCGPPGCGKTERIGHMYAECVRAAGFDAAILLLPTADAARSMARRLPAEGMLAGVVDARIITFPQLADGLLRANHRLAPEIGLIQQRQIVRTITRQMVAEGAVRPDEFARRLTTAGRTTRRDVETAAVYAEYQATLQRCGLFDAPGRFWEARDLLRDGLTEPFTDVRLVLVDGFADFPTTQMQVLAHLADTADETIITLPYGPDVTAEEICWLPGRTLSRLQQLIPRAQCEPLPDAGRPEDGLAYVRRHFLTVAPPPAPPACAEQVDVFVADTERDELEIVAEQMKTLLLDGVAAEQIALALPAPAAKADLIESVFGAAGVPYSLAAGQQASVQPLVRLVGCLLRLVAGEFHRDDVVALIRNPLIDFDCLRAPGSQLAPDDVYPTACAAGVVAGRAQWADGLELHARRLQRRLDAAAATRIDDADEDLAPRTARIEDIERQLADAHAVLGFLQRLCELIDRLPSSGTADQHVGALTSVLEALGLASDTLPTRVPASQMRNANLRGFDEFCEQLRLYREVCAALDRGAMLSLSEFAADVTALIAQTGFRAGRDRPGRVTITAVEDGLRQRRVEYLFLAGLTQGAYPALHHESVLYEDADRLAISAGAPCDLRTRGDREAADAFFFHEALSAATRRLSVSYSDGAGHDELVLPSAYVEELAGLADPSGALPRRRKSPRQKGPLDAVSVSALREGVFIRLFSTTGESTDDSLDAAYNLLCDVDACVSPRAAAGAFAEHARYSKQPFDQYDGVLDAADVLDAIASPGNWGIEHTFSASQLSAYGKCPFRFFAERVLGLEAIREPDEEPDRVDLGGLAHEILADFVRRWGDEAGLAAPITVENLDAAQALLRRAAEDAFRRREREQLVAVPQLWQAVCRRLLEDLLAWPSAEADVNEKAAPGLYAPLWSEKPYGYETASALVLGAGERLVRVGGYIDIIELVLGPNRTPIGYAVYDFKTSSGLPSVADIQEGRELQLPLYIMAAERMIGPEYGPLKCLLASYYQLRGGKARRSIQIVPDSGARDALLDAAEGYVLAYAEAIRAGRFAVAPAGKQSCEYCDIRRACRFADWRSEMKSAEVSNVSAP
jgi:ATP-dependent helicase/DNAse subunit B